MPHFKNLNIDAHDEQWATAVKTFREGDRAGALWLFKKLAKEGCAPALVEVGNIYEIGWEGAPRDLEKAKEWYLYAVETIDDARAHIALGRLYLSAAKSDEDYSRAWYHLSLLVDDRNHMGALYGLGVMREMGWGVEKDIDEALRLYGMSADQGHLMAKKRICRIMFWRPPVLGAFRWLKVSWDVFQTARKNLFDSRLHIKI